MWFLHPQLIPPSSLARSPDLFHHSVFWQRNYVIWTGSAASKQKAWKNWKLLFRPFPCFRYHCRIPFAPKHAVLQLAYWPRAKWLKLDGVVWVAAALSVISFAREQLERICDCHAAVNQELIALKYSQRKVFPFQQFAYHIFGYSKQNFQLVFPKLQVLPTIRSSFTKADAGEYKQSCH